MAPAIGVFDKDGVYVIEFLTEMQGLPLTPFDDRHQRMQRIHAEVIIVLLHGINFHYLVHIQSALYLQIYVVFPDCLPLPTKLVVQSVVQVRAKGSLPCNFAT